MIAYIQGKVVEQEKMALVIDVHGVGYRLLVASSVRDSVQVGDEITLRVYHHISDNDQVLFGFAHKEDHEYFELLLTVPSVGPKTALGILDAAPFAVMSRAVAENDLALLTSISGIGKRTAERMLVELKGKMAYIAPIGESSSSPSLVHDTVEALTGLGYSANRARSAVSQLPAEIESVEDAVKFVLQRHRA